MQAFREQWAQGCALLHLLSFLSILNTRAEVEFSHDTSDVKLYAGKKMLSARKIMYKPLPTLFIYSTPIPPGKYRQLQS